MSCLSIELSEVSLVMCCTGVGLGTFFSKKYTPKKVKNRKKRKSLGQKRASFLPNTD